MSLRAQGPACSPRRGVAPGRLQQLNHVALRVHGVAAPRSAKLPLRRGIVDAAAQTLEHRPFGFDAVDDETQLDRHSFSPERRACDPHLWGALIPRLDQGQLPVLGAQHGEVPVVFEQLEVEAARVETLHAIELSYIQDGC